MAKAKAKAAKKPAGKFSLINEIYERTLQLAQTTKSGQVKIKRTDLKKAIEGVFEEAGRQAAKGNRIRFPVLGALAMKPIKERKAGKGTNPFTGEPMTIKARPASRKPRWSFSRGVKDMFADKKNWR